MNDIMKAGASTMVPKDIADMTLKDLMSSKDVEIHKKDNVLRLKRPTPSETIDGRVRSYDDAAIISQSRTCRTKTVQSDGDNHLPASGRRQNTIRNS